VPVTTRYCGRFAPSPTGELHFGSLVTAVASFARARQQQGDWLVRIDDIDPPREQAGAADSIIATLIAFGMTPDRDIIWQSQRYPRYQAVLAELSARELVFACQCTRSALAGLPHQGRCISAGRATPISQRLLMPEGAINFVDLIAGPQTDNPRQSAGDVVLWRADDLPSYQLANVVDDWDFGITEIVRGSDLLDSTGRQIALIRMLGAAIPGYAHLPLVLGPDGQKLSKQNLAQAIDRQQSEAARIDQLNAAWRFLSQLEIPASSIAHWWQQAIAQFEISRIQTHQPAPARAHLS
jgi:glutamyl-Q tRNA(Asp) synthetase